MKIASWNINSVRMRQQRLLDWLARAQPDVLCLQELKATDDQFPTLEVAALGYTSAVYGQRTYNGVAILSRSPVASVERGLQDAVEDSQARLIAATIGGVRVVSIYAPNGQAPGSEAYIYKLEWFRRLRRYLEARWSPSDPVLVCGDFNVAPEPRDVYDPVGWAESTLFSPPERAALVHLCEFGLVDTFRLHHPEAGAYSWWDYRRLSFPKGKGLRIDHVLASQPLAERCTDAGIDREARKGQQPSDHAPTWAEFDV